MGVMKKLNDTIKKGIRNWLQLTPAGPYAIQIILGIPVHPGHGHAENPYRASRAYGEDYQQYCHG